MQELHAIIEEWRNITTGAIVSRRIRSLFKQRPKSIARVVELNELSIDATPYFYVTEVKLDVEVSKVTGAIIGDME